MAFRTIGCKLNQCETAQMQEALLADGYELVDWDRPADIRVINTCTVTAKSDRTCRHEIRTAKRLDPDCLVAVTGCYAQIEPETVAAIPGVDLVLGNLEKLRLAEYLGGGSPPERSGASPGPVRTSVSVYPADARFESDFITHFHGYTRAFLKVQNGCDSRCAYCIIPLARGPARSMPRAEVLKQVRLLVERDFKEVVLTGIHLGGWGRDTDEGRLADLVAALVADGGAERYRLSSIEPLEVDARLLDEVESAGDRVARHFHLPLQSGSDSVLRRMNRPYSTVEYDDVVSAVARRFPDAALGADVIVGFPGETDADFEQTLHFVEHTPLTYLHVFSYSDRPGTAAQAMTPKVHPEVIHERSVRLRASGERKKTAFRDAIAGTEQRALFLRERADDGRIVGITGNYVEVLVGGADTLMNSHAAVRLERPLPDGRWDVTVLGPKEPAR